MNAKPSATGSATLEALGNGRFKVRGCLDAETVTDLLEHSAKAFRDASSIEIDLGGVPEGDSAGLALLIEWIRRARKQNQQIRYINVPRQIASLASISEVDGLLMQNGSKSAK